MDTINALIPERSREPLLSAAQEADLAQQVEAGLYATELLRRPHPHPGASRAELAELERRGSQAWAVLWRANLRLVWHLAWQCHRRTGIGVDELNGEGQLALAEALMRWDHTRGTRISTLAWKWISHALNALALRRRREAAELAGEDPFVTLQAAHPAIDDHLLAGEQPHWWTALSGAELRLARELRRDPVPSTDELCRRLQLSRSGLSRLRQRTRSQVRAALEAA